MRFSMRVNCACESSNLIFFNRPPSTSRMDCENCGSETQFKVLKGDKKGQVKILTHKFLASDLLKEVLETVEKELNEEAERKAKENEVPVTATDNINESEPVSGVTETVS